jgi:hypothetical protein
VLRAFEAYNELALRVGLPQAAKLTPDRQRKIRARLVDYGIDGWLKALSNIPGSKFLRGLEGDRKWRCSLDFLISPAGFSKVHDAVYTPPSKFAAPSTVTAFAPREQVSDVRVFERGSPEYERELEAARRDDPARAETIELRGWVKAYPIESAA